MHEERSEKTFFLGSHLNLQFSSPIHPGEVGKTISVINNGVISAAICLMLETKCTCCQSCVVVCVLMLVFFVVRC